MTVVTGQVQDIGMAPLSGALIATAVEFRTSGDFVVAPESRSWPIVNGDVSVDLLPGPTRITIQVGSHARDSFDVIVPEEPVTLARLVEDAFPWTPSVVSAVAEHRAAAELARDEAVAAANEFDLTATSSTLAPGASATVTVSGDGPAYSLAFGVPQGAKGDKGDEGEISQAQLDAAVASLVDNAPEALNTLDELASALGDDPNFATTVSAQIGQRARIDGAPAQYDTLGKLVAALQNHELGGSTDASLLTGALTDQVDVTNATVQIGSGSGGLGANLTWLVSELDSKSDVGHTHPVTDLTATGTRSSSTYLRGDGSWATPTDTTYSVPTQAEAEAGTATTGRAFSAQRVRQAAEAAITAREWVGTQAQYDAIGTKNPNITYYIV